MAPPSLSRLARHACVFAVRCFEQTTSASSGCTEINRCLSKRTQLKVCTGIHNWTSCVPQYNIRVYKCIRGSNSWCINIHNMHERSSDRIGRRIRNQRHYKFLSAGNVTIKRTVCIHMSGEMQLTSSVLKAQHCSSEKKTSSHGESVHINMSLRSVHCIHPTYYTGWLRSTYGMD